MNLDNYINHSGGAIGGDSKWDSIGKSKGFLNHKHYWSGNKTPIGNTELSKIELEEGIIEVKKTYGILGRPDISKYYNLHGRNWFQVKNADAIFAIGVIVAPGGIDPKGYVNKTKKEIVAGGTGYAVEMAIQHNKPTYVFDQVKNKWFIWKTNTNLFGIIYGGLFSEIDTPILTKNYAGIGTREINENGIKAIIEVYDKTLKELKDEERNL
jgi:hypothetical protein